MFKHYGLTGQTVKVRKSRLLATNEEPWAYGEQDMKIEEEYTNFLLATVLPHMNSEGYGLSTPYKICIHKNSIATGEVRLNGGAIQQWER